MPEIIVKLGDRVVQKYFLYKNNRMSIGRAPDNDIALENPAVSRRHATIQLVNGRYILEDNQSANGTYVNGVRISKTEILDKDVITIGKHKLHFYNQELAPPQVAPVVDEKTFVVNQAPAALLRVVQGKQSEETYAVGKAETRVGRAADNDIRLHDWFVSKHHAVISRRGMSFVIKDLDSWRHTMVNGEIIEETTLKNGDEIQFGPKITMRFELSEAAEPAAEVPIGRRPVELGEAPPPEEAEASADGAAERAAPGSDETGDDARPQAVETLSTNFEELERQERERAGDAFEEPPEVDREATELLGSVDDIQAKIAARNGQPEEAAPEPVAVVAAEAEQAAASASPAGGEEVSPELRAEIELWEKTLQNPSAVIRKQAARKLKKLTGRDYDVN